MNEVKRIQYIKSYDVVCLIMTNLSVGCLVFSVYLQEMHAYRKFRTKNGGKGHKTPNRRRSIAIHSPVCCRTL